MTGDFSWIFWARFSPLKPFKTLLKVVLEVVLEVLEVVLEVLEVLIMEEEGVGRTADGGNRSEIGNRPGGRESAVTFGTG